MSRRHSAVAIHKEGISEPENVLVPTPSHFEKLYLSPEQAVAGKLRLTFGNPTPIALGGFLIANSSVGITLLGWHGAGADAGNASALVGSFYFLAAVCLYAGGIGEWILGNTFPATVFFTFGGFWATFGATITPFYAAITGYADPSGFYDTFAVFLIWMAVLCLAYLVCSLRTNVCLFGILLCFVIVFPCLATSYYYAAAGNAAQSKKFRVVGGAFVFISTFISWYLWFSMILESVDFPFSLPVGDLSGFVKGKTEKEKEAGMV